MSLGTASVIASGSVDRQQEAYWHYLDYLKCYAIVLVVALHVAAPGVYQWQGARASSWWLSTAFDSLARTAVPLFLMASGATLLDSSKVEPVGTFLMRRVRRIAVPLLVWSIIYLADRRWPMGEPMTAGQAVRYLALGTTFYHLPFFYYLIGLYLSAPVLARFAENARGGITGYFFALWAAASVAQLASALLVIPLGMTIPAIAGFSGYFVVGRLVRDTAISKRGLVACILVLMAGWLITLFGTYWLTSAAGQLNELLFEYGRPNVIMMTIASYLILGSAPVRRFADRYETATELAQLGAGLSFGIFLIHPLLLQLVLPSLNLTWNTGGPLIGIPATTVITLGSSGMIVWALRQTPVARLAVS